MSTSGGTRSHTATATEHSSAGHRTLRERGAEATRNLREAMRLPTNAGDTGILSTALAEAAAEEGRQNPRFAGEVRRRYEALLGERRPAPQPRGALPPLKPVRTDLPFRLIDPFAPPDPQFLIQVYGRHQLEQALARYSVSVLKRTVAVIERQHPSTKPTNRGRKDAVISYIVKYSGE
jgi:hypothetical protein